MPKSSAELLAWAEKNPGRFSYPMPPDFIGTSFLKQVLSETIADKSKLLAPVKEEEFADGIQAAVRLSRQAQPDCSGAQGKAYPQNYPDMKRLMADGELDITFAFNPADASAAIAAGELPDTVRSFTFPGGTLGNTHFVAIPYNANAKAGALVLADFLISPEAQAHKQDPKVWGDPTVLNIAALSADEKAAFDSLDLGIATLKPDQLGPALDEPHPSWMVRVETEWKRRYGAGTDVTEHRRTRVCKRGTACSARAPCPLSSVILLLDGPVLAGLAGTLLPAFSYLPALGGESFSLDAFRAVFARTQSLAAQSCLSLWTGILQRQRCRAARRRHSWRPAMAPPAGARLVTVFVAHPVRPACRCRIRLDGAGHAVRLSVAADLAATYRLANAARYSYSRMIRGVWR